MDRQTSERMESWMKTRTDTLYSIGPFQLLRGPATWVKVFLFLTSFHFNRIRDEWLNATKPTEIEYLLNSVFGYGKTNAIKIIVTTQTAKGTTNAQKRISSVLLLTFNSYLSRPRLQIKFPRSASRLHREIFRTLANICDAVFCEK